MKATAIFLLFCLIASLKMPDRNRCIPKVRCHYYKNGKLIKSIDVKSASLFGTGIRSANFAIDGRPIETDSIVYRAVLP